MLNVSPLDEKTESVNISNSSFGNIISIDNIDMSFYGNIYFSNFISKSITINSLSRSSNIGSYNNDIKLINIDVDTLKINALEKDAGSINLNKYTSNSNNFKIKSGEIYAYNDVIIENMNIDDLFVKQSGNNSSIVAISNSLASNRYKNLTIENDGRLSIGGINADNVTIIHHYSNNNLFISSEDINNLILNTNNINTPITFNANINSLTVNNGTITGTLNQVEIIYLKGIARSLYINGSVSGASVEIVGFLDSVFFKNINSFNYTQSIDLSSSSNLSPNISFNDSTLDVISNINNLSLSLFNTTLNAINLIGDYYDISSIDSNTNIPLVNIKASKQLSYKNLGYTNSLYLESPTGKLTGDKISNIDYSIRSGTLTIHNGEYISLDGSFNVSIYEADTLEIIKGTIDLLIFTKVGHLNIDISDTVMKKNIDRSRVDDINIISNINVKIAKTNNLYNFNKLIITGIPDSLTIGNKLYSKQELTEMFSNLTNKPSGFYILGSNGILETHIPTEESVEPYFDENGIYTGTDNSDVFTLSENRLYHINGKKGDDIYNFTGQNSYQHIIEYTKGDGHDTINSTLSYLSLNLKLNQINSTQLTFSYDKNVSGTITTLYIFDEAALIFTINNYIGIRLQITTVDTTITNSQLVEILSTIYGTDNDDIIEGNIGLDSYIYPGKGNDIINISYGYNNKIYYKLNDGHKVINSPSLFYQYTVVLSSNILKNQLSYIKLDKGRLNILINDEIVLTINHPTVGRLLFSSNNELIALSSIQKDLFKINGTSGNDIIEALAYSHLYMSTGNDIINVNYPAPDGPSSLYYAQGDGFKTIILSPTIANKFNIYFENQINSFFMKFEYDINNHDTLNIYYKLDNNSSYFLIFKILNYNILLAGRAVLNTYMGPINHLYVIHPQAEKNYQALLNAS